MSIDWSIPTIPSDQIWMVVVGFIIAFILAFGIGANDVANSFGTSVGSKVLTLRQACILAAISETLGAVLLGAKVSDTIRKGIIDITPYANESETLMVGNVAALAGSACWLVCATLLRLPVSATHSIVGATVGFALVAHGSKGINWHKLGLIVGSWFISPLLAGIVSTGIFFFIKFFILKKDDPLEPGLKLLPVFYAFTIVVNLFSVFYDGPEILGFHHIPLWGTFILSFGTGLIVAVVVRFAVVPWQRRVIKAECRRASENPLPEEKELHDMSDDKESIQKEEISALHADSAFTSSESSTENNSRRNSADQASDKVVLHTSTPMALQLNEPILKNGKAGITTNCVGMLPINGTLHTDLSTPADSSAKKALEKHAGKISKAEDAPLIGNEYKLGSVTPPGKSPVKGASNIQIDQSTSVKPRGAGNKVDVESLEEEDEVDFEKLRGRKNINDAPETAKLFSFLQILTAIFGAFAHGGNDVSNAIGPLVSLWLVASTGVVASKASTPIWILLYGGFGISIGLFLWGRKVIKTMGEDLSKITPSSGFCIEIGSALTVLVASNIGIPISTTHCKVGSVVLVGQFRSRENVDWSIFRNILVAWVVTLPITGGISAAIMAALQLLV